ncbi:hypothetical protein [Bradyrhizobium sp. CSA112]|uniref:hypothetical protein n=1 Tax=Bradyrhizobium sp. CSA112 TaxID=2699170 RepID=UPI0023AF59EF|nr:hypothetical protein [Bradyrhizobium sp. CSA112]
MLHQFASNGGARPIELRAAMRRFPEQYDPGIAETGELGAEFTGTLGRRQAFAMTMQYLGERCLALFTGSFAGRQAGHGSDLQWLEPIAAKIAHPMLLGSAAAAADPACLLHRNNPDFC